MRLVKVASKSLSETGAVSLFTRLPTPAPPAARRSHVKLTVTLARLRALRSSPTVFEENRDCWQSNEKAVEAADFRTRTPSQSHVEVRVMSMRMFATVINPLGTPMKLKNTKIMCSICHEREKKTTYNGVFEVSSILS